MDIKFGQKSVGGSNGQAALALVVGLFQVLEAKGILSANDIRQAVINAEKLVPNQPSAKDREVGEMLSGLKTSI